MKRILTTFLALGLCIGFAQEKHRRKARERTPPNTLTAEEQQQGFELLFDGKSLDKFDVRPGQEKIFLAADGAIKTDSSGAGSTLLTKADYANFVLKAEFRANPDVNSGIMLRNPRPRPAAADGKKKGGGGGQGYELQIRDRDPGHYSGGNFLTGSIVNVAKAPPDARIKPGEWNTVECTMDRDHIVVLYNGRKVVDAHDSKLTTGAIGLQLAHPEDARGADIEFRNLKVKRLP
jgi:hypothetical protein